MYESGFLLRSHFIWIVRIIRITREHSQCAAPANVQLQQNLNRGKKGVNPL